MTAEQEHFLETYRSLITVSLEGFRYLALVNGGAVVAVIAYLGGADKPAPDLKGAMLGFIVGLVSCGLALLFAYLTQLRLLNEIGREKVATMHTVPLNLAIVLYAVSLAAFSFGAWSAVSALS